MTKPPPQHLGKEEQIKLGSYYTPKHLVNKVFEFVKPYTGPDAVILDSAAGYGAFLVDLPGNSYRAGDFDPGAVTELKKLLGDKNVFHANSLRGVRREMFRIRQSDRLIAVGNPPYNDTTSEFRNGKKGENDSDPDLKDRDLGISFLKSYDKLRADYVCVLHPLSYLIKEANFKRLKSFRENYRLKRGLVFSSAEFTGTGSAKFPIVIALYERHGSGMAYEDIAGFKFEVLDSPSRFKISDYPTTDGLINKYPPRKNEPKTSGLNLYFYTFRDFNSLKKNKGFMNEPSASGIVVTPDNFYQYAYLNALKNLFKPENEWIFGNLSPLRFPKILNGKKKDCVSYALLTNKSVHQLSGSARAKIARHHKLKLSDLPDPSRLEQKLRGAFSTINFG